MLESEREGSEFRMRNEYVTVREKLFGHLIVERYILYAYTYIFTYCYYNANEMRRFFNDDMKGNDCNDSQIELLGYESHLDQII